jgi:hypothetical protein
MATGRHHGGCRQAYSELLTVTNFTNFVLRAENTFYYRLATERQVAALYTEVRCGVTLHNILSLGVSCGVYNLPTSRLPSVTRPATQLLWVVVCIIRCRVSILVRKLYAFTTQVSFLNVPGCQPSQLEATLVKCLLLICHRYFEVSSTKSPSSRWHNVP